MLWMVLIGVILTVAVVTGAAAMLRTVNAPEEDVAASTATMTPGPTAGASASEVGDRPDCPATGVGGVALDCLGGENAPAAAEGISVVNVWAWWCGPCRDELPLFDEFAAAHPEYSVVGVHADRNPGHGAALLDELGIRMSSYQDLDNTFAGTLGLPGVIPVTVVFDGDEMLQMFPQAFTSVAELESAVAEAVAGR